jgi:hypothetical protein
MILTAPTFTVLLETTEIVVVVLFVVLWFLAARPSSVRHRTGPRKAARQPRPHGVRFLRTTNRRSFQ